MHVITRVLRMQVAQAPLGFVQVQSTSALMLKTQWENWVEMTNKTQLANEW